MPGRPILFGTTEEFLRQFGLNDLKELPSLDVFGVDEESIKETLKEREENEEDSLDE